MPITWFFEGVAENGGAAPPKDDDMRTLFTTRSGNDLAKAFLAIEDAETHTRSLMDVGAGALCGRRSRMQRAVGGSETRFRTKVVRAANWGSCPQPIWRRYVGDKSDRLAEPAAAGPGAPAT